MNELTIVVITLAASACLFIAYCSLLDVAAYIQDCKVLALRRPPANKA